MRYFLATLICGAVSLVGAVTWFSAAAPSGEGGFGYAKALPLAVPILTALLFGISWFPITLAAFLHEQLARRSSAPRSRVLAVAMLIVSALPFIPSSYRLASWAAEMHRREHLEALAAQPNIAASEWAAVIDSYCIQSERGLWPDRGDATIIKALTRNRSTPPEVLGRLADGLDDGSYLLFEIAQHPNCPARLVRRFSGIPLVVPYVARNAEAPPELLESLSLSTNIEVRICVARNLRSPRSALERLVRDSDDLVRRFANDNLHGSLGDWAWR